MRAKATRLEAVDSLWAVGQLPSQSAFQAT